MTWFKWFNHKIIIFSLRKGHRGIYIESRCRCTDMVGLPPCEVCGAGWL